MSAPGDQEEGDEEAQVPPEDPELIELSARSARRREKCAAAERAAAAAAAGRQRPGPATEAAAAAPAGRGAVCEAHGAGMSLRPRPSSGFKADKVERFPEDELQQQVESLLSATAASLSEDNPAKSKAGPTSSVDDKPKTLSDILKQGKASPVGVAAVRSDARLRQVAAASDAPLDRARSNSPTTAIRNNVTASHHTPRKMSEELEHILARTKPMRRDSDGNHGNESNNNSSDAVTRSEFPWWDPNLRRSPSPSSFGSRRPATESPLKRLRIGSTTLTTVANPDDGALKDSHEADSQPGDSKG